MKSKQFETLENRLVRFSFDAESGALESIVNKATGNEYLRGSGGAENIFGVYHDFDKEFNVTAPSDGTPCFADSPEKIAKQRFSPSSSVHASFSRRDTETRRSLTISYKNPSLSILAKLTVALAADSETSVWKLTLKNFGSSTVELMACFPLINGLRLGDGRRNLMVVHDQAGYILPLWSAEGGIYGNAKYMSMQWGCVFDEQSGDAFGFIVDDPEIRNKDIKYEKPAIKVNYFPPVVLQPGETYTLPKAQYLVYTGDWKKTATAYAGWCARYLKSVKHADWVRNIDAHGSGWFSVETEDGPVPPFPYTMESFREVVGQYQREPMDNYEFAFHCQRSRPKQVTGKTTLWTDGDNVLREDLGGAKALREGLTKVHGLGYHFTFYVEGYLCPGDADIVTGGKAQEWAVMNKDGTNTGSYTRQGIEQGGGLLHMCPGAKGWQNHLAKTAARLVRETGADGVRLDSLGFYFFPCYNPKHKHANPFDYNVWVRQLLEKVATAVRKVNPDCLLTTEGGPDFFAPHFDGTLTQHWLDRKIAVTRDVSPMRIAVPDYAVVVHGPCGPVATSLMGYPGGVSGSGTPDRMNELDLKWRAVRHTAAKVIRWGDAAHDNPTATRKDVECRRFSSPDTDVIVGARPLFSDAWKKAKERSGVAMNAHVDVKKGRASYQVTFESGKRKPRYTVLWDIEKLQMSVVKPAVTGGKTTIEVDSNWFMVVFGYSGAPPVANMSLPVSVHVGEEIEVRIDLVGAPAKAALRGKLTAPVLGLTTPKSIQVSGVHTFRVAEGIKPGNYPVQLDSRAFAGCRRYLEVMPGEVTSG
jgi:hypothetical protein